MQVVERWTLCFSIFGYRSLLLIDFSIKSDAYEWIKGAVACSRDVEHETKSNGVCIHKRRWLVMGAEEMVSEALVYSQ